MEEKILDINQVAGLLHISRAYVYRLIQQERLRAMRVGAHLRIRREELERYMREAEEELNRAGRRNERA